MRNAEWNNLFCSDCGHARFVEEFEYKWHPSNGTSKNSVGLSCRECGAKADASMMVNELELKWNESELQEKREMLEQRQRELRAAGPKRPAVAKASTSS